MQDPWLVVFITFLVVNTPRQSLGALDNVYTSVAGVTKRFEELKNDVVGVSFLQGKIDQVNFQNSVVNGQTAINKIAETFRNSFQNIFTAVRNLKDKAEELFATNAWEPPSNFKQCCEVDGSLLEFNKIFNKFTGPNMCYRISKESEANPFIATSNQFVQVMKRNQDLESAIKWQYFGTEYGTHAIYPMRVHDYCDTYDPRFRPWYVETVTLLPKDVVIVFDKSGSMSSGERLKISKEAASIVVNTLNPNDRVALVTFSSDAWTPPGDEIETCYASKMAYAIPDVKHYLNGYIENIKAQYSTLYATALQKAFSILKTVANSPDRKKVILFLTDGEATDSDEHILKTLSELNAEQQNSVTILTYGLGLKTTESRLLEKMANMTEFNASAGEKRPGYYTEIQNTANLRLQLGTFYNIFQSQERLDTPIVTVPYTDFSGLGTITSVCLPVYSNMSHLEGGVCVDITLSSLAQDIKTIHPDETSYVFIIDDSGRTMLHPNLPDPGQEFDSDPIFLNIKYIEPAAKAHGILDLMLHPNTSEDQHELEKEMILSRGNTSLDGVDKVMMKVIYSWKKIPKTNFIVCLVSAKDKTEVSVETSRTAETFLYHKQESWDNSISVCAKHNQNVTLDMATVKFAPQAFQDISSYLYTTETKENMLRYKNIIEGGIADSAIFQRDVSAYVAITEDLDSFWKTTNLQKRLSVVSQYFFASINGVLRMFPGLEMSHDYDYTKSMWFVKAIALKNNLVISGPHTTAFSQKNTYTATHTILQARTADTSEDNIVGVVGVNFDYIYLQAIVQQSIPECKEESYECILIDSSGFLIYHPAIDMDSTSATYHLAEYEPDILNELVNRGLYEHSSCIDFAWKNNYHTWKVTIKAPLDLLDQYPHIHVTKIIGTNLHLCIKSKDVKSGLMCDSCNPYDFERCPRDADKKCHCPCYDYVNFHHCTNTFEEESTDPACLASATFKSGDSQQRPASKLACFPNALDCTVLTSQWDCALQVHCSWCFIDNNDGSCNDLSICKPDPNGSVVVKAVVPVVILLIVLVVVVIIVVVLYRRTHQIKLQPNDEPYDTLDLGQKETKYLDNDYLTHDNITPVQQSSEPSQISIDNSYLTHKDVSPPQHDNMGYDGRPPPPFPHQELHCNGEELLNIQNDDMEGREIQVSYMQAVDVDHASYLESMDVDQTVRNNEQFESVHNEEVTET